jgi:hypothetical protein
MVRNSLRVPCSAGIPAVEFATHEEWPVTKTTRKGKTMAKERDYSKYDTEEPPEKLVDRIRNIAKRRDELEQERLRLEEETERNKVAISEMENVAIPEVMAELGLDTVKTEDGIIISLGEKIRASIPAGSRDEAMTWLEEHGFEKLIKREIKIAFGREDESWARKFMADCAKRKRKLNLQEKKEVHPKTLEKFVRERLANEEDEGEFPEKLFGVFRQKIVKVEFPKQS